MGFAKIKASAGGAGGGAEKPPAGNHAAILVGLFDMGHQWQEPFTPKDKGYFAHRAFFVWELVSEKMSGSERNHVIGIDLTMSLKGEKSKLRKFLEGRMGKKIAEGFEFDPMTELGQPCLLNVIEKNGYPKIEGVAALPKGWPLAKSGYEPVAIGLEEFRTGVVIPDWCPYLYGSPLADHINACREIGGEKPAKRKAEAAPAEKGPIPF